jgi:transposase
MPQWLRTEAWPNLSREQRRLVASQWRYIRLLTQSARGLDRVIAEHADASPAVAVLRTIPGIGPYRGLLLATELLPITRFARAKYLVSYAGLAPIVRSSGGHVHRGGIPRGANKYVRGAFVSALVSHVRHAPESSLSQYYARLKARVGWPTARIAAARKLAHIVHHLLVTGEAWRG